MNPSFSIVFSTDISLADINALYKLSGQSGRASPTDVRIGLMANGQLLSGARLQRYADGWLLRNLCTRPEMRGRGLASRLLEGLAANVRYRPLLTLPLPHLESFYESNGFVLLADDSVDSALAHLLKNTRKKHKRIRFMAMAGSSAG